MNAILAILVAPRSPEISEIWLAPNQGSEQEPRAPQGTQSVNSLRRQQKTYITLKNTDQSNGNIYFASALQRPDRLETIPTSTQHCQKKPPELFILQYYALHSKKKSNIDENSVNQGCDIANIPVKKIRV